jgi:hypothetical protein
MKLPNPSPKYDLAQETERKRALEQADGENYKRGNDVEIGGVPSEVRKQRLILRGTVNGNRYSVTINDTTSSAPVLVMTKL